MSLGVDKVVGVLNNASHAAGLILIVQSRTKLIQNSRENLHSNKLATYSRSSILAVKKASQKQQCLWVQVTSFLCHSDCRRESCWDSPKTLERTLNHAKLLAYLRAEDS